MPTRDLKYSYDADGTGVHMYVIDTVTQSPPCRPFADFEAVNQAPSESSALFTHGGQAALLPSAFRRYHRGMLLQGISAQHKEFLAADGRSSRVGQGFSLDGLPPGTDCNGHGTHISGTAAGLTYGVAKNAWIHPCELILQDLESLQNFTC